MAWCAKGHIGPGMLRCPAHKRIGKPHRDTCSDVPTGFHLLSLSHTQPRLLFLVTVGDCSPDFFYRRFVLPSLLTFFLSPKDFSRCALGVGVKTATSGGAVGLHAGPRCLAGRAVTYVIITNNNGACDTFGWMKRIWQ